MAMAEQRNDKAGKSPASTAPRERGGWLAKIAPGVRNLVAKRETPENLWVKCPDTGEMIYRSDLEAALWVTPSGSHMRIGAAQRLRYTFDDGRYELIEPPKVVEDPLKFPDERPYPDRLKAARKGIILFHDPKAQTAAMLPAFLRYLRDNDYHVVHVVSVVPRAKGVQ
ncbi:acetyl-coenzyme A carboxylase carboxyl transferase subunit beta [mine drainage metagenome]|uniref:Acetyl-coenzyme A carboxylase carboxyl transferase subunit beta n=1 Tax=mine drainage metagenome TaxID=410659 RepID=A0A1J5P6N4_9ZZZZ